jgi:C4-dicarboxylate-specific signal transduction histidine kinase
MKKISESIASNDGVLEVLVQDLENKDRFKFEIKDPDDKSPLAFVESPLAYAIGPNDLKKIGTLRVTFSQKAAIDKVAATLVRTISMNILKSLLVSAILLVIFNRIIIKPVVKIAEYFRGNDNTNPRPDLIGGNSDKNNGSGNDEISEMITAIHDRELMLREFVDQSKKTIAKQTESLKTGQKVIADQKVKITEAEKKAQEERVRAEAATKLAQLGEMAGGIAHEINNPLTILMGYQMTIRMLMKREPIDLNNVETYIGKTEAMVLRMSKIVNGLRNFARDGAKDPYAPSDVKKMLDDVAMLAEMRMKSAEVKLTVKIETEDLIMDCRSIQIEQVLVNLLNNAHDAIAEMTGDRWIELKAFQQDDKCVFWVTDCGLGIPPEVVEKIFTPFFTTKEVGKGTGIGLSISFGIIHDHNGVIYVDKDCPNTRFVLEIPLRKAKSDPESTTEKGAA